MATRIEEGNVTPDYEVSISNIELDDDSTVLIDVFNTELEGLKHFVKNNRNIVRRIDTRIKSQNDEIKKAEAGLSEQELKLKHLQEAEEQKRIEREKKRKEIEEKELQKLKDEEEKLKKEPIFFLLNKKLSRVCSTGYC